MMVRRATADDALDVLEWRNDPHTRAMSKTADTVEKNGHLAWFARAIDDPDRLLLIGEDAGKIGMVRFDRVQDGWLANINIASERQGEGYGRALLSAGLAHVTGRIMAEIKPENEASIRLFRRCGFKPDGESGGLLRFVVS